MTAEERDQIDLSASTVTTPSRAVDKERRNQVQRGHNGLLVEYEHQNYILLFGQKPGKASQNENTLVPDLIDYLRKTIGRDGLYFALPKAFEFLRRKNASREVIESNGLQQLSNEQFSTKTFKEETSDMFADRPNLINQSNIASTNWKSSIHHLEQQN